MTNIAYLTLQVLLTKADKSEYFTAQMQVLELREMRTARVDFEMPLTEAELAAFIPFITDQSDFVGEKGIAEKEAKKVGEVLFNALFHKRRTHDDTLEYLHNCLTAAAQYGGLRIQLTFLEGTSELINLPWEYMCEDRSSPFLLQRDRPPVVIVRYIDTTQTQSYAGVGAVRPPLRVLVVIASPKDDKFAPLNTEEEWGALQQAVEKTQRNITLERVEDGTLEGLRRWLDARGDYYDIVHFIGHGGLDPERKEVVLAFEGAHEQGKHGTPDVVPAERFGAILSGHKHLNLIILDCCRGAYTLPKDMFTGVAQGLERQGVPAIVAMQSDVTERAATSFASGFYQALGNWQPVEEAFREGLKAMIAKSRGIEWGTPVMYMRPLKGYLFERQEPALTRVLRFGSQHRIQSGGTALGVIALIFLAVLFYPHRDAVGCKVIANNLNVRRGPNPTYYTPPLITLNRGDIVTPVARYARYGATVPTPKALWLPGAPTPEALWLKVKVSGVPSEGWVSYYYNDSSSPDVPRVAIACNDEATYINKLPVVTRANLPPTDTPRPSPTSTAFRPVSTQTPTPIAMADSICAKLSLLPESSWNEE